MSVDMITLYLTERENPITEVTRLCKEMHFALAINIDSVRVISTDGKILVKGTPREVMGFLYGWKYRRIVEEQKSGPLIEKGKRNEVDGNG